MASKRRIVRMGRSGGRRTKFSSVYEANSLKISTGKIARWLFSWNGRPGKRSLSEGEGRGVVCAGRRSQREEALRARRIHALRNRP